MKIEFVFAANGRSTRIRADLAKYQCRSAFNVAVNVTSAAAVALNVFNSRDLVLLAAKRV